MEKEWYVQNSKLLGCKIKTWGWKGTRVTSCVRAMDSPVARLQGEGEAGLWKGLLNTAPPARGGWQVWAKVALGREVAESLRCPCVCSLPAAELVSFSFPETITPLQNTKNKNKSWGGSGWRVCHMQGSQTESINIKGLRNSKQPKSSIEGCAFYSWQNESLFS